MATYTMATRPNTPGYIFATRDDGVLFEIYTQYGAIEPRIEDATERANLLAQARAFWGTPKTVAAPVPADVPAEPVVNTAQGAAYQVGMNEGGDGYNPYQAGTLLAMDEADMDEDDWAQCSVVAEITLKATPAQQADWLASVADTHLVGILTRSHAASAHGQPVILDETGQVLDAVHVAAVHLLEVGTGERWKARAQTEGYAGRLGQGVPEVVWQSMAEALASFGIRVTRVVGKEQP